MSGLSRSEELRRKRWAERQPVPIEAPVPNHELVFPWRARPFPARMLFGGRLARVKRWSQPQS